jgi:hypothetical protein
MTIKLQDLHQDFASLQQLVSGVFIGQGPVYMEQVHQQIQLDGAFREVTESSKRKATTCEDTVLKDSISKGICQHCATCDCVAFNKLNGQLPPLIERRLLENMTKDSLSEFFLNKKNPNICSGAVGYISLEEIFIFLTIKIQDLLTFCSK